VRTLLGVPFYGDQAVILPINKIAEGRGSPKGRGCQCPLCPQKLPRQRPTGVSAKARLGGISKRGDSYLRRLLVNSAHTVLLCSKAAKTDPWLMSLLGRKPRLVAAVALANKTARVAWAIMSRQDTYRPVAAAA